MDLSQNSPMPKEKLSKVQEDQVILRETIPILRAKGVYTEKVSIKVLHSVNKYFLSNNSVQRIYLSIVQLLQRIDCVCWLSFMFNLWIEQPLIPNFPQEDIDLLFENHNFVTLSSSGCNILTIAQFQQ